MFKTKVYIPDLFGREFKIHNLTIGEMSNLNFGSTMNRRLQKTCQNIRNLQILIAGEEDNRWLYENPDIAGTILQDLRNDRIWRDCCVHS